MMFPVGNKSIFLNVQSHVVYLMLLVGLIMGGGGYITNKMLALGHTTFKHPLLNNFEALTGMEMTPASAFQNKTKCFSTIPQKYCHIYW